jgi:hypothetical protein
MRIMRWISLALAGLIVAGFLLSAAPEASAGRLA